MGTENTGLRGTKPTLEDPNPEKSSTRTNPKTAWRAQKRRKRCAWKTMPGVGRKAHFWLHTRMFCPKNHVPKSTIFPRMLAGVGQIPHGNALSHRAANGNATLFMWSFGPLVDSRLCSRVRCVTYRVWFMNPGSVTVCSYLPMNPVPLNSWRWPHQSAGKLFNPSWPPD